MTRHARSENGTIAVLAAAGMIAVIAATALGVDLGRLAYTSRDQQFATDRAALDAVRAISDLWPADDPAYDPQAAAEALAIDSLSVNKGVEDRTSGPRAVVVQLGTYDRQSDTFVLWEPASDAPPTAVRVETTADVRGIFAAGDRTIVKEAIAAVDSVGVISVGSTLVTVDPTRASLLNGVIGGQLQTSFSLSVLGWQGLVDADLSLGEFFDRLGPLVGADFSAGSPDAVLPGATVTVVHVFTAAAQGLTNQGDPASLAAAATLWDMAATLQSSAGANTTVAMEDLLNVTTADMGDVANASINVFELVTGTAYVADGENFISLPDVGVTIPGLTNLDLTVGVIEGPRFATGPAFRLPSGEWATVARTAQTRVRLDITLEPISISGVSPLIVTVPIFLEGAKADAALTSAYCVSDQDRTGGTTLTDTSALRAFIGALAPLDLTPGVNGNDAFAEAAATPAFQRIGVVRAVLPLIGAVDIATIDIRSRVDPGYNPYLALAPGSFVGEHEPLPETVSGGAGTLGLGQLLNTSVTANVGLETNVQMLGINVPGVNANVITSAVIGALTPVLDLLDAALTEPLTDTLGIQLGTADTTLHSVTCNHQRQLVK